MERLTLTQISELLTEDVIDKVFKFKTNSEDSIQNIEVTRAAPAGEGLISAVYRVTVNGNDHKASFVAKGLVNDLLLRKSLNCTNFFKRESLFFSNILPVLIDIQKSLGAKERVQSILPICYSCHVDGKNDYILMEDLSEKEFISISNNPTKYERDTILKVLAHFHSVSIALRIRKPEVFAEIMSGLDEVYFYDGNKKWFAKYLQRAIDIDKDVLAEVEGTDSNYYKKFEEVMNEDVYEQLIRLAAARGNHAVINHGDAWCPNFLCSKEKAITIDFQLLRCASPATDLSFFLSLCSNLCCEKEDFNEAIGVYHKALECYLNDMGLDANEVFSFDALQEELKEYGKFGLFAASTTIPLLASERCDVLQSFESKYSGFDRIPLEELWRLTPMASEEHRSRLVNAVRIAVDHGFI